MKKNLLLVPFLLFLLESAGQQPEIITKKGWNFGFLPAVAYDSDLGIYYGIIINPFDYGDGSVYPDYLQSVFLQVSGYSGGSSEHILEYVSYSLLPSTRFSTGIKYTGYKAYPFYGYNGNESYYNVDWENDESSAYRTRMFYRLARKNFRILTDIQDTVGNTNYQWHLGFMANYCRTGAVDIVRMNKRLPASRQLPDTATLYNKYCEWGLLDDAERDGGITGTLMAGLIYDSRDRLTCPGKGVFSEVNLLWMPPFLCEKNYSYLKFGLIHRQYITLVTRRLIFAYRFWLNVNLAGDQPFYTRQLIAGFQGNEGYGGYSTLRGVLMQRIVAEGFILGTAELRSRLVNFRFINQNWYIGAVAFIDAGRIIKPVSLNLSNVPQADYEIFFRPSDRSLHKSAGGGLKLAMNENFVLSAEFAAPFDRQDGVSGLYLGLGYQF